LGIKPHGRDKGKLKNGVGYEILTLSYLGRAPSSSKGKHLGQNIELQYLDKSGNVILASPPLEYPHMG
jgi:hypothetical protein